MDDSAYTSKVSTQTRSIVVFRVAQVPDSNTRYVVDETVGSATLCVFEARKSEVLDSHEACPV